MSNELQHQRKSSRSPAPIKAWPSAALPQLATTLRVESAAPEQSPAPLRARSRPSQPPQQQQQPAVVVHQQVHVSLGHDGNLLQLPMAMAVPMPQHPELPVPVPSSSTPGASKWRHRNKQQMRDGVPLLLQHYRTYTCGRRRSCARRSARRRGAARLPVRGRAAGRALDLGGRVRRLHLPSISPASKRLRGWESDEDDDEA